MSDDANSLLTVTERTPTMISNYFSNLTIKKKITSFTANKSTAYLAVPWNQRDTKDTLTTDQIKETPHTLKIHVFSSRDYAGRNTPTQMRNLKVTMEGGRTRQQESHPENGSMETNVGGVPIKHYFSIFQQK